MSEKDEIRRLKKENHALRKKIYKLEAERVSKENGDEAETFASDNYFSFLLAKFKQKKFFPTFQKYFKNSLWITRIFKWGLLLYKYIQAGALVILYTAAFILVIPIVLAAALLTLIVALVLRSKNTKLLFEQIKNDAVFVIPKGKENFDKASLCAIAAKQGEKSVLVVSPFFLDKKGVGDKEKMYVCFRKEYGNVFILRNYFFFYFRRRLKTEKNCTIEEIYFD